MNRFGITSIINYLQRQNQNQIVPLHGIYIIRKEKNDNKNQIKKETKTKRKIFQTEYVFS